MTLPQRRILYLSFTVVFVLAAGALLFRIQGFRYDFGSGTIERTGAISLESIPGGATIILNGSTEADATPLTVQSLAAGDYDIIITGPGLQPWHKTLAVKPTYVTFTGQVRLWPQPQPGHMVMTQTVSEAVLSPNRQSLLFYTPQGLQAGLWLLNLTSGETTLLARPSGGQPQALEWSPSGHAFLETERSSAGLNWRIFNLANQNWEDVSLPSDVAASLAHWGQSDDELLVSTGQELYQFDRRTNLAQLLWNANLQDFRANDGLIFGLTQDQGQTPMLKILNPSSLQLVPLGQNLVLSSTVNFLPSQPKWLPLLDQDRHTLYLLHSPLTSLTPVRQLPEVTAIDWSADGSKLLLNNQFEIWEYGVDADKLTLFSRLSTPLGSARLFNDEPYLIFSQDKQLWALEFDSRGEQQRWLLASLPASISDLFTDPKGQSVMVELPNGFSKIDLTQPNSP